MAEVQSAVRSGWAADHLVFDELDEATPEARALARERLSHSDYKRIIELSNPSLPDYGIDEVYQKSDQRHWTLKCPACGKWTALEKEFPRKAGEEVRIIRPRPDATFYRACPKCEAQFDLSAGEWVADYPDRPIHGYRISQLFSSKVDPGEILLEYRTTRFLDRFYNLKIGIPCTGAKRFRYFRGSGRRPKRRKLPSGCRLLGAIVARMSSFGPRATCGRLSRLSAVAAGLDVVLDAEVVQVVPWPRTGDDQ